MGKQKSFRSRAVHCVADITTGLLNPISDKPSSRRPPPPEDADESKRNQLDSISEEQARDLVGGPDTSSFTAFLYSLLSSEPNDVADQDEQEDSEAETGGMSSVNVGTMKETSGKKSLFSKGKQSLRAIYQTARFGGQRNNQDHKGNSDVEQNEEIEGASDGHEMKHIQNVKEEAIPELVIPEASESSLLLSEHSRRALYASLPAIVRGRKWLLLYSTWRHGISLSTLYRKSLLWPGLSLLVVGDRKGTVFGGLVEAPLIPTDKKYQGSNSTFVFTNKAGNTLVFRPTGANRYFTLCSTDFLALGGGGHFALYLDGDLLSGSSSFSETYGNPCLANSQDFEVKEIELWGFVYGSKYDEILSLSKTMEPGICGW